MSFWAHISDLILDAAGTAFSTIVEQIRTIFEGDPATRAEVAFSVAFIALSAKMAKADGVVTPDEVTAFREVFQFDEDNAAEVSALYNLAKRDTAGFETYARQMSALCRAPDGDEMVLSDIMDALFHIAKADGVLHERENEFLQRVASAFQLSEQQFDAILARHVDLGDRDPWRVLGFANPVSVDKAKARHRELVRQFHPDAAKARGMPDEFLAVAEQRMVAINDAWSKIQKSP
ncbi:MAG: DnaJ family molecular chaperone [Pseudomonadota bacterium]